MLYEHAWTRLDWTDKDFDSLDFGPIPLARLDLASFLYHGLIISLLP